MFVVNYEAQGWYRIGTGRSMEKGAACQIHRPMEIREGSKEPRQNFVTRLKDSRLGRTGSQISTGSNR